MKKRKISGWIWLALIIVLVVTITAVVMTLKGSAEKHALDWLLNPELKLDRVQQINGTNGTATISGYYERGGQWVKFIVNTGVANILAAAGSASWLLSIPISAQSGGFMSILLTFLPFLLLILIYWVGFKMMSKGGANGVGIFGMGKNRAQQTRTNIHFSDVGGIKEEKDELIELVDYFKNSKKYIEAGAKAPKGVLLEGPPGTGKTLLARAVAGEANVPFFSIAGSEFEEMFAGVGASRVRDMFAEAKKNSPSIIFIDEIDAVGSKRFGPLGARGNEQTLNQLLTEMDGFDNNSGVIVMAATNRADVLDSALLRPGRFDRVIQVALPDIREREEILKVHARNKKIAKNIDWHNVASRTPGFSGAQLANVLNEAAILMVREKKDIISVAEVDEAIDRVIGGPAKKSKAMTPHDKDIVSYHESGHALVGLKLSSASKVQKVTIIPRGHAGGYTITTPKDENIFSSKQDLMAMITGFLGGRAAEEIIFGAENITTGAHDDLDKATNIARRMVVQFGMSELGMTKYVTMSDEAYGKNEGSYSDETANKIDKQIHVILDVAYAQAVEIINNNRQELDLLAESLKILETITAEQIEYIDKELKLPAEVQVEKERNAEEARRRADGDIFEIDVHETKTIETENPKTSTDEATPE